MTFGPGSGWGGGGGGVEEPLFKWFGPPGSGAFITPGKNWPTPTVDTKMKIGIVAVLALLLLMSRDS